MIKKIGKISALVLFGMLMSIMLNPLASAANWDTAGNNLMAVGKLGSTNNWDVTFITADTEVMRINTNQKVGIGTTSPQQKLTLGSGSNFATEMAAPGKPSATVHLSGGSIDDGIYYYVITALDGAGETVKGIESDFVEVNGGSGSACVELTWTAVTGASSYKVYRTTTSGDYSSPAYIGQSATNEYVDVKEDPSTGEPPSSTTAYVNKITASGNSWFLGGNVGIGTTSPGVTLHIKSSVEEHIRVQKKGQNPYMDITSGGSWCGLELHSTNVELFSIWEGDWDTGQNRFHIRNGGNIGIGTTTPDKKLEVKDSTNPQLRLTQSDAFYTDLQTTSSGYLYINPNGGRVGIGEASPDSRLEVKGIGTTSATSALHVTDSAGNSLLFVRDDGNVGIEEASPTEMLVIGDDIGQLGEPGDNVVIGRTSYDTGARSLILGQSFTGYYYINLGWAWNPNPNLGYGYLHASYNKFLIDADPLLLQADIASHGDVGIGTSNPLAKLDVDPTIISTEDYIGIRSHIHFDPPGTGSTMTNGYGIYVPSVSVGSGDSITNMYALVTEANAGNVGIGTTSPNAKFESSRSAADPATSGSGTDTTAFIRLQSSGGGLVGDMGLLPSSPYGMWIQVTNRDNLANTYPLVLNPNGGNVGIGDTSPDAHLVIGSDTNMGIANGIGDVYIQNDLEVDGNIYMANNLVATQAWVLGQGYGSGDITAVGSMTSGAVFADSTADDQWLGLGSSAGRIEFQDGATDDVVILDAEVGIGTTNPQGLLHVSAGTSGDAVFKLQADTDDNNEDDSPMILLWQDGDKVGVNIGFDTYNVGNNKFMIGRRYDYTNDYETFVIDTETGNIGIGTKNPGSYKLYVDGSVYITGDLVAPVAMLKTAVVDGILYAIGKAFRINHTLNESKYLVHGALEGPEWGVIYRGNGTLANGQATIYLPDYYDSLTMNNSYTVQLTARGSTPFTLSYDSFNETAFVVYGSVQTGEFDWEVKATRDDIDPLEVEPDKEES